MRKGILQMKNLRQQRHVTQLNTAQKIFEHNCRNERNNDAVNISLPNILYPCKFSVRFNMNISCRRKGTKCLSKEAKAITLNI